jgi:hypothetical protein
VVRFSGLASFPDGTVGTAYFVGAFDYTKGAGPFSVYYNVTLNDGSVLWYKATGTAAVEGTKTLFNGTVSVLGGKGRFEGAKGDGTINGARLTPLDTTAGGRGAVAMKAIDQIHGPMRGWPVLKKKAPISFQAQRRETGDRG